MLPDEFYDGRFLEPLLNGLTFKNQALLTKVEDELFGKILVTSNRRLIFYTSMPHITEEQFKERGEEFTKILNEVWKTGCCLSMIRKINVPCGSLAPLVFVIGERPGQANMKDDVIHRTLSFGGTAAKIRMAMHKIGLHHSTWYTNIVKCSAVGNTRVLKDESDRCLNNLAVELEILNPKFCLVLGSSAYNTYCASGLSKHWRAVYVDHPSYVRRMGWSASEYAHKIRSAIDEQIGAFL